MGLAPDRARVDIFMGVPRQSIWFGFCHDKELPLFVVEALSCPEKPSPRAIENAVFWSMGVGEAL